MRSPDFFFAVKASRYVTHMMKLKVGKPSINQFLGRAMKLKEKRGPALFQLPSSWKVNIERLSEFLDKFPVGIRYTFEFRNETWYNEDVSQLLKAHNGAFCIYELDGYVSPKEHMINGAIIYCHPKR